MNIISFLLLFALNFTQTADCSMPERKGFVSPHHEFLDPIIEELTDELKQEYKITSVGVGGGTTIDHKLHEVSLDFEIEQSMNQDELRRLMIDITERLIEKVNADENLKRHLYHLPFGLESITLGVFNKKKNGSDIYHPGICTATNFWGKLGYTTLKRDDPYGFTKVHEETYEEALEKINRN